jgi:hypothetical protein
MVANTFRYIALFIGDLTQLEIDAYLPGRWPAHNEH